MPTANKIAAQIGANRSDEEPDRLDRLNAFRGVLVYFYSKVEDTDPYPIGLYDHKGWLGVNWSATPNTDLMTSIRGVWENWVLGNTARWLTILSKASGFVGIAHSRTIDGRWKPKHLTYSHPHE